MARLLHCCPTTGRGTARDRVTCCRAPTPSPGLAWCGPSFIPLWLPEPRKEVATDGCHFCSKKSSTRSRCASPRRDAGSTPRPRRGRTHVCPGGHAALLARLDEGACREATLWVPRVCRTPRGLGLLSLLGPVRVVWAAREGTRGLLPGHMLPRTSHVTGSGARRGAVLPSVWPHKSP